MSLQSAEQFTLAVAKNPALSAEVLKTASSTSFEEAAVEIAAIGKREGFDFSPAEAIEAHQALSDSDLDNIAGGGNDGSFQGQWFETAAGGVLGQMAPGGSILAGGVSTTITTGDLGQGAMQAAQDMNNTKNAVQEFFETKW